ncbi:acyltransferase [Mucilaginibacter sp. dw_454]|uniref:acyltransferase family protein n=1 Tax=Mucilaginibacter sp. dw_454 TaxID=2720079 RepID=UPI001BD1E324|nr:acyltransferase [Mucilaginibacter sp. dw_454]
MKFDTGRNHTIDLMRFVAASCVALFHFNKFIPYVDNFYRNLCNYGFWGVPVFFVISGYCIHIAQEHVKTPKEFIIKRLFRIYPPYWFSLIVILAIVVFLKIITGYNSAAVLPKTFRAVLATIFLYTNPVTNYKTMNWVYWTLCYELAFYLIIFLALFLKEQLRYILLVILSIATLIIPIQNVGLLFFLPGLPQFLLGYALYVLIHKNKVYGAILWLLSMVGTAIKHPGYEMLYLACGFTVCILIYVDFKKPLPPNIFSKLGDYSYSLYLLHVPVAIYLLGFIKSRLIMQTNVLLNIITDLMLLLVVIIVSKYAFLKIELPAIKLGKKMAKD